MLENLRRQGASIFVYLIFCLLIAIFIINFRPGQTRSDETGCTGEANPVIAIDGTPVTSQAYHVAYSSPYNRGQQKQRIWIALETLISRELLAQEAEHRGLLANAELIEDQIKKGNFFLGGYRVKIPGIFDENGIWNYNAFKGFLQELNVSKNSYETEQRRSMLAWMMAQLLEGSVQVSRDEALQQFLYENNTATYDVVAFRPSEYGAALEITDADVDRFLATHEDEVKARYKADERTYKGVKPQLQLREIFIEAPKDKQDEAKQKLEAARTAIAAGKQKFADAAKELNTEEAMKASGGELGWRSAETPSLGDKALSDAVKTLKPGDMTPVIATDKGVYLVTAESQRQGDLSYDQVKREIAKQLARDDWGKEAAKRAAIKALEAARNGVGLNLEQLYEKEQTPGPGIDIQKILNDPNLTDEQKQQILQQMLKNAPQHGQLEVESKDVPAAWYAEGDGAGGSAGSGSAPATGSGSATAAGSGSATAAGSGSATAPGSGSGSDLMTPSKDELPKLGDIQKPKVTRYGPSPRSAEMPGLGNSKEAAAAVFDQLQPGNLAKRIYEADGNYIVVQLIAREQPNVADFEKDADQRVEELRAKRAQAFLESWLRDRCLDLAQKQKIIPNMELLRETDDKGNLLPTQYRPCMSFR